MTTGAGSPVFIDTNVLVYASVVEAPLHAVALNAVQSRELALDQLLGKHGRQPA